MHIATCQKWAFNIVHGPQGERVTGAGALWSPSKGKEKHREPFLQRTSPTWCISTDQMGLTSNSISRMASSVWSGGPWELSPASVEVSSLGTPVARDQLITKVKCFWHLIRTKWPWVLQLALHSTDCPHNNGVGRTSQSKKQQNTTLV